MSSVLNIKMVFTTLISLVLTLSASIATAEEKDSLKILNWNVLYGFNHKKSIKQGVNWIERQKPDVVALQELNGHKLNNLKNMAKQWGHDYAAILKEKGFPVGLTSKQPIEVIERRVKGFHHGYLHCRTYGIHFFVVHFWPKKDHEAKAIIEKIKPLLKQGEKVVVTGDFNTYSEKDKEYLSTRKNKQPLYSVINMFEKNGFVDLVHKHDKDAKYSFPSPIIMPKWAKTLEEVESKRERIDFILADQNLQKFSTSATILTSKVLDKISDHYPVVVEFKPTVTNMEKNKTGT